MVDDHLRRAERRLEGASLAGEAALLRRRLRAGDLAAEELRIAAAFGHEPARLLFPEVELLQPSLLGTRKQESLLSVEQATRAVVSLARALPRDATGKLALDVLEAIEAWLTEAARPAGSGELEDRLEQEAHSRPHAGAGTLAELVSAGLQVLKEESSAPLGYAIWIAAGSNFGLSDGECREALANELVPWLLRERDPVRDRVRARARLRRGGACPPQL